MMWLIVVNPASSKARIEDESLPEGFSVVRRPIESIKTDPLGRTWIFSQEGAQVYWEIYDPKQDDWKIVETQLLGHGEFDEQGRIWIPQGRQFHVFDAKTETSITIGPEKRRNHKALVAKTFPSMIMRPRHGSRAISIKSQSRRKILL